MFKKYKSYGERYNFVKVKIKLNRLLLLKVLFIVLVIAEIVLGILWCLGY